MDIKEYKQKKEAEMMQILFSLIENWEEEIIEFKEAGKNYKQSEIGQYFSAISNEANLHGLQYGCLVFGVRNKDRKIVGTDYRDTQGLNTLKNEIASNTTSGISFLGIYEVYPLVDGEKKRVIMFQIPAAITAVPTGWHNIEYGRDGESLVPLSSEKRERIRRQEKMDWSKQIVPGASLNDLDKQAIQIARKNYKEKMSDAHISEEVDQMSDEEFLERRKLVINGNITNAAFLLLGNSDYDYKFQTVPEASWRVYDSKDNVKDYLIFKIPFITLSNRILEHIRNLTYRFMPNQMTLFPIETKQYDPWVLRELLNNCIAHSDYTLGGRIYVNEFEDKLIITNPGTFIPGSVEPILKPSYTSPFYRNQLLAESMVMFKMIDSETTGIRRVFTIQREKFFPLPDYELSEYNKVEVCIYGKEINEKFKYLLYENENLDLATVYLLDQVQKGKRISKEAATHLRKYNLVEGRMPNLFLAAPLARTPEEKIQYIKNKAFDDQYYRDLIIKYLKQYGRAQKADIRELLWDKLPDNLSHKQKNDKVSTILTYMRKKNIIKTDSDNHQVSYWILVED